MNECLFFGRISSELDIKKSNNDTTYLRFSVAVKDGKETSFLDFTAFGKQAETIYTYFRKGSRIGIVSRAVVDSWTNKEGEKRSRVNFIVKSFTFVDNKDETDKLSEVESKPKPKDDFMDIPDDALDEVPFK